MYFKLRQGRIKKLVSGIYKYTKRQYLQEHMSTIRLPIAQWIAIDTHQSRKVSFLTAGEVLLLYYSQFIAVIHKRFDTHMYIRRLFNVHLSLYSGKEVEFGILYTFLQHFHLTSQGVTEIIFIYNIILMVRVSHNVWHLLMP